ncbi:MAG TPA: Ig-like domain-containing protein [Rhodopila sp.]|nr:Ig-like domain-containing protein [Rhodopila sp.]
MTGLALAACSHSAPPQAASGLRVYSADVTGAAKACEVPAISPKANAASAVAIKLVNDGGWCGIPVHQDGPKPYDAGLLTTRPAHGDVTIHEVGDNTRIDYTPDHGFAGNDSFAVKLLPGAETLNVTATVTAPAMPAAAPAAPPAARPTKG